MDISRIDEIVTIINDALDERAEGKDYSFLEIIIALTSVAGMLHSDVVSSGAELIKKTGDIEDVDDLLQGQQGDVLETLVIRENSTPLGLYSVPSAAFSYLVTTLLATYADSRAIKEEAN